MLQQLHQQTRLKRAKQLKVTGLPGRGLPRLLPLHKALHRIGLVDDCKLQCTVTLQGDTN